MAAPNDVAAPVYDINNDKAIFNDSVLWQGEPTQVFVYYGMPTVSTNQNVPAMGLVHGGGGTAFSWWWI